MGTFLLLFLLGPLSVWAADEEVEVKFEKTPNCETVQVVDWAAAYSSCYEKFKPLVARDAKLAEKAQKACKCISNQLTLEPSCKQLSEFVKNPKQKDEFTKKAAEICAG